LTVRPDRRDGRRFLCVYAGIQGELRYEDYIDSCLSLLKADTRAPEALDNLLRKTRHRGYGENFMTWNKEEKIASIAVPIRGQQQLLGCLNLVYVAKAMTIEQAVARYLPALQRTAKRIEHEALEGACEETRSAN